jgi:hypothetical protein
MVLAFVGSFLFLNFKLSYFFKKYSSFFVFISFSILYFITAFRDIRFGGSDAVNYQFLYNSLLPNEISNLFTLNNLNLRYEIGFLIFMFIFKSLSFSYFYFQVAFTTIALGLLYFLLKSLKLSAAQILLDRKSVV